MGNSVAVLANNKLRNRARREKNLFVRFGEEKYIKPKSIVRLNEYEKGKIAVNVNAVYICMASLSNGKDYVKKVDGYKKILKRRETHDIVYAHQTNYVPIEFEEVKQCFLEFLNLLPITAFKLIRDKVK